MKFTTRIILFSFLSISSLHSFSQNYFFKNYGIEEGLPNNQTRDILQAKDNTLWISSMYGVFQFDGKNFKSYTKEEGLCANQIRNIFEDSKGRIWCGSWQFEGISIIDNGEIITPKDSILKKRGVLTSAYEDEEGNIWLFGLKTIIKYANGNFQLIYESPKATKKTYYQANSVVEGVEKNTLYVSLLYDGIVKITLNPFKIEKQFNEQTHGINNICYSGFKDKNNVIWIGYYGGILSIINDEITQYNLPGDFNKNRVWSITEDKDGYLWLALYGGGFVRWDKQKDFLFIDSKNGLKSNYCYDLIIDKEGNKWITTEQNGLIQFKNFAFNYFTKANGMPTNIVTDVAENSQDEIIVSTEKGLVSLVNDTITKVQFINHHINSIAIDDDQQLWLATKNGYGVLNDKNKKNTIQLKNKNHTYYSAKANKKLIISGLAHVIINDSLWFNDRRIDIKTSVYLNNKLLIGFSGGVADISDKALKKVKGLSPLSFNTIYSSLSISSNEAIMGNPNEMVYLKYENDSFTIKHYPKKKLNNIKGFNAFCLNGNDLWIGSDNSLSRINWKLLLSKDSINMQTYNISDGFIKGKTSADGILCDQKGNIWVATSAGLMKFNPSIYQKNTLPPKLKLNAVKLFSEPFNQINFTVANKLIFPYNKNHFTFNLSAISLSNPSEIKYKYRLKGLEKNWSKPSANNNIIYSFIPPGDYQFEFIASNGNSIWEDTPLTYSFTISPPFWATLWFRFLSSFTLLLLIFGAFYYQKQRAIKKSIIQEKFTADLINAQEDERKRISKGLHDGIGQQLLIIKNAVSSKQFEEVPEIVNNTIEEVRSISRNLHPFQLEKLGLTKALETMVEDVAKVSEDLFFTEDIDNVDNLLSKEKEINLYRVLQECVNNILKHAKANAAKLLIKKTDNNITIEIMDNGVGFDLTDGSNKLNSLGLKSIQERVKIINGSINFNSTLGKGTKIMIIIEL